MGTNTTKDIPLISATVLGIGVRSNAIVSLKNGWRPITLTIQVTFTVIG